MSWHFFSNTNKNNCKYFFNVYEIKGLAYKIVRTKDQDRINKFFFVLKSSLNKQHKAHNEVNQGITSKTNRLTISPLVRKCTFAPLHSQTYPFYFSHLSAPLIHWYPFFTLKIMSIIRIKAALKGSVPDRIFYISNPGLLSRFPVSVV